MKKNIHSVEVISVPPNFNLDDNSPGAGISSLDSATSAVKSAFQDSRRPIVIRGIDIGSCNTQWTLEYLKSVNKEKKVKVHRSQTPQLDFRSKNFVYETISFTDLIEHCAGDTSGEQRKDYLYLRSLGLDPRGRDVSDISIQFPELFADLKIPKLFPPSTFFSSVFRITSPNLQLWTHYDTCDNILIQVRGRKRIVLFPPSDALNLYLDGDKSLVLDIDNPDLGLYPNFDKVQRFEVNLEEGDIVFIPSLWFHNVIALNFSISVNVFWKNLDSNLYDKKDTYGNRDFIPAQLGFKTLQKAADQLKNLPKECEDFYLRRMIISLQQRLEQLQQD